MIYGLEIEMLGIVVLQESFNTFIGWVNYQSPQPASDNTVVVCFSVHWGQYGSVTTWNGTYDLEKQNPMIKTQWLLVRSNSKFVWDHMLTGSSTFMLNKN